MARFRLRIAVWCMAATLSFVPFASLAQSASAPVPAGETRNAQQRHAAGVGGAAGAGASGAGLGGINWGLISGLALVTITVGMVVHAISKNDSTSSSGTTGTN